jgi:hypothetical protein
MYMLVWRTLFYYTNSEVVHQCISSAPIIYGTLRKRSCWKLLIYASKSWGVGNLCPWTSFHYSIQTKPPKGALVWESRLLIWVTIPLSLYPIHRLGRPARPLRASEKSEKWENACERSISRISGNCWAKCKHLCRISWIYVVAECNKHLTKIFLWKSNPKPTNSREFLNGN